MVEFEHNEELEGKGQWRYSSRNALITCPLCGNFGGLRKNHTIDADGRVYPSLVCPWAPCKFHDDGILKDWKPR